MRVRRPLSMAVGSAAVAAALAGSTSAAAGGAAAVAAGATVSIAPAAVHVRDARTAPPTTSYCETHYKIACYQPAQIQQAYNLGPLFSKGITGKGQTIVIVDSYGSPTVRHDLGVFDQTFHLPSPPSLKVIQPAGPVAKYRPTSNREGWAGETELDVEWSHAMAPDAKILLVETPTSENEGTTGFPAIVRAETYVVNHHLGGVISQSFSATEQTFPSKKSLLHLRGAYQDAAKKGVTVLAASGDSGAADVKFNASTYYLHPVTSWPDSDPLVTGVGGTQLRDTAKHGWRSVVWNDTYNVPTQQYIFGNKGPNPLAGGGGKSVIFSRPRYQKGVAAVTGDQRGVPDISMSGACNGAVDMFQSFQGQRRLVPDLRHQRGHPPVRRRRRPGRPGRRAPAGPDQPGPVQDVRPRPGRGHRGRDQGRQHRLVHPGRQAAHRDRLQRPDRLRPRLRGRHRQRGALRAEAGAAGWLSSPRASAVPGASGPIRRAGSSEY